MWVFGYGSLIWKADFPYEKKIVGYIKGYERRFYQKSTDHRGVPAKPGRVVTLLASADPDAKVWGMAYKISSENVDSVVNHLDFREKGGYRRKTVLFHPCSSLEVNISKDHPTYNANSEDTDPSTECDVPSYLTIYIGAEDNPNFAGAESIETIADHILNAHGPSGSNIEYLYKLASAMRLIAPGVIDDHLFSLEKAVRKLDEKRALRAHLDDELT